MWETGATIASASIAAVALIGGWLQWRKKELRKDDVLAWSNDVIEALQTLLLTCIFRPPFLDEAGAKAKFVDLVFETSILVERGRLFFKNEVVDDWGKQKEPAYRGYRPIILDHIVVAHQIACAWSEADELTKSDMRHIAEHCLKSFVSLAQKEVGRGKTASADTGRGGDGADLDYLLAQRRDFRLDQGAVPPHP